MGPVVYFDLRAVVIREMFSLIFSLPGLRIEFCERYIPRILIESFLLMGKICDWEREVKVEGWKELRIRLGEVLEFKEECLGELSIMSLVFLGWIEMLFMERN